MKTVERLRTTDSIEKAFVEHDDYNYLYQDGDSFVFMQPQTFDQITVGPDVIGDKGPTRPKTCRCSYRHLRGGPSPWKFPSAPLLKWWKPSR